jgi:hypothetical protein
MKDKMTLEELKGYIEKEAQKLYKITLLKEEKRQIEAHLNEGANKRKSRGLFL